MAKCKSIRIKDYDYSTDGFYFVTICAHEKSALIEEHRKVVEIKLLGLPSRFSGLAIDHYALMPTHIHVIMILSGVAVPLGRVVRSFKAVVTMAVGQGAFWQPNYYEHVIRSEQGLKRIREYVEINPLVDKIAFEQFYEHKCRGLLNRPTTEEDANGQL